MKWGGFWLCVGVGFCVYYFRGSSCWSQIFSPSRPLIEQLMNQIYWIWIPGLVTCEGARSGLKIPCECSYRGHWINIFSPVVIFFGCLDLPSRFQPICRLDPSDTPLPTVFHTSLFPTVASIRSFVLASEAAVSCEIYQSVASPAVSSTSYMSLCIGTASLRKS